MCKSGSDGRQSQWFWISQSTVKVSSRHNFAFCTCLKCSRHKISSEYLFHKTIEKDTESKFWQFWGHPFHLKVATKFNRKLHSSTKLGRHHNWLHFSKNDQRQLAKKKIVSNYSRFCNNSFCSNCVQLWLTFAAAEMTRFDKQWQKILGLYTRI